MKKAISILLVLALSVSLFAIPVSASEEFEHPMPPSYLCDCDNPIDEYWDGRYRALQPDWSDEIYHYSLVYDIYICGNCYKYIYVFVMEYREGHDDGGHWEDCWCYDYEYER